VLPAGAPTSPTTARQWCSAPNAWHESSAERRAASSTHRSAELIHAHLWEPQRVTGSALVFLMHAVQSPTDPLLTSRHFLAREADYDLLL
jgi:hypothetical protein